MTRPGDHAYREVMRSGRHLVDQFAVVQQRDGRHRRADPGEGPVVGAAAPAQPEAAAVHPPS